MPRNRARTLSLSHSPKSVNPHMALETSLRARHHRGVYASSSGIDATLSGGFGRGRLVASGGSGSSCGLCVSCDCVAGGWRVALHRLSLAGAAGRSGRARWTHRVGRPWGSQRMRPECLAELRRVARSPRLLGCRRGAPDRAAWLPSGGGRPRIALKRKRVIPDPARCPSPTESDRGPVRLATARENPEPGGRHRSRSPRLARGGPKVRPFRAVIAQTGRSEPAPGRPGRQARACQSTVRRGR